MTISTYATIRYNEASSMPSIKEKHALSDVQLPSKWETLKRIWVEFRDRGKLDIYIRKLVWEIPEDNLRANEAVEKVTSILVKTFAFVRSTIADQLELFAVSFYQLPMLRKLESSMQDIELDEESIVEAQRRKAALDTEVELLLSKREVLNDCISNIRKFVASSG